LGYGLNARSFDPGGWLDVTLYWQALGIPPENYTLAVQLVCAIPGDTSTLINFNTWTGGGTCPTVDWRRGDVIADCYRLSLPRDVSQAQAWNLQVVMFGEGGRLPFSLDGRPAGDAAVLAVIRVGATQANGASQPTSTAVPLPTTFGGAIALDDVEVSREADGLRVILYWRCLAGLSSDYVVFVHVYSADSTLLATGDAPPLAGGFSTSLWEPGDRVTDVHSVELGQDTAVRLGIGWYDPVSGGRQAVSGANGSHLQNDELLVPIEP